MYMHALAEQLSLSRVTQNASTSYGGIAPIELQIAAQRQFLTTGTIGVGLLYADSLARILKARFSEV